MTLRDATHTVSVHVWISAQRATATTPKLGCVRRRERRARASAEPAVSAT
jgi:hypothetical protein